MLPAQASERAETEKLAGALPVWTYSKRQRTAMDPIDLVFVGSKEEVEGAFAASGWESSQPLSALSGLEVGRALAEERAYADAPMRPLLLEGAPAAMTFQKTLTTFEKRHHLRVWKRREQIGAREVWASAASRDIGPGFSFRRPIGFTHRIQGDLDLERDQVAGDLVAAGCVESLVYASGRAKGRVAVEGGRTGLRTRGGSPARSARAVAGRAVRANR